MTAEEAKEMTIGVAIAHLEDLQRMYLGNEKFKADVKALDVAIKALEQQPTKPTASWKKFDDDYIKCSKCERIVKFYHYNYRYCPNCGARMGESEGNA